MQTPKAILTFRWIPTTKLNQNSSEHGLKRWKHFKLQRNTKRQLPWTSMKLVEGYLDHLCSYRCLSALDGTARAARALWSPWLPPIDAEDLAEKLSFEITMTQTSQTSQSQNKLKPKFSKSNTYHARIAQIAHVYPNISIWIRLAPWHLKNRKNVCIDDVGNPHRDTVIV